MDGTTVDVLKIADEEGLGRLLQGQYRRRLEAKISLNGDRVECASFIPSTLKPLTL
jgi:hypothetical protein